MTEEGLGQGMLPAQQPEQQQGQQDQQRRHGRQKQPDMTGEFSKRDDCFAWRTFTVRVTGATASTRLAFSNTGQWFLDDVVVTK